jgi:hypothetical protein
MNVNNLLEGASPYQSQQNEAAKLSSKWEKSGLLEGIESSTEANNMAMLLENQAKQLVNEANSVGTRGNDASFSAGNSEAWAGVALPLVRRVFGEIVAKDLVSVQPMNLPAGLIFYLDFQYGNNQDGFTAGDSLYNASDDLKKTDLPAAGTKKGLYGAGTFGYSVKDEETLALFVSGGGASEYSAAGPVHHLGERTGSFGALTVNDSASVEFDEEFIASLTAASSDLTAVDEFRISTASFTNADFDSVRAWAITGTGVGTVYNQYNKVDLANGYVRIFAGGTTANKAADIKVQYLKTPDNLNDRGDFEDTSGTTTAVSTLDIPSIDVQLRSDTVAAKTRKLKAQWTPEFAQDLNAYHSIDAEAELTSILSEYISMEIDLEVLDMLIQNADTTAHWSAKIAREVNDSGVRDDQSNTYYTKMSWFQTLGVKLQSVSNTIHQKTLRGGANFMVVSPKVSTILESIPGFAADSPGDQNKYAMGVQKVGAINSRYTVYKNPYLTENVILMGYKGSQFLETGAVFAPYIPLIMTPLVYDPVSFTPRKGIMTRYAKKMVRPDFYGKVICHDLNLV